MVSPKSTTNPRHSYSPRHGQCSTPEYHAWRHMRNRCYRPEDKEYKNYGARGITVCDRWRWNFTAFLADMGKRPTDKHSLERKNNDAGYSPDNCVWATKGEQSANRRMNRFITFNGRTQTMAAWSRELGLDKRGYIIRKRLLKGWSVERALSTPRLGKNRLPL